MRYFGWVISQKALCSIAQVVNCEKKDSCLNGQESLYIVC